VQYRFDRFYIADEEVNKLNFADIWFDQHHICVFDVIDHPILLNPE
jgi:hypothetical protein